MASWINRLSEYCNRFYNIATTEEIREQFSSTQGKEEHENYMKCIDYVKKCREKNGILEPALWAAQLLTSDLKKSKMSDVHIADFGCGEMHFAKHLISEAIKNKGDLGSSMTFHLSCYDLADRIDLLEFGVQHILKEVNECESLNNLTIYISSKGLFQSTQLKTKIIKGNKFLQLFEDNPKGVKTTPKKSHLQVKRKH